MTSHPRALKALATLFLIGVALCPRVGKAENDDFTILLSKVPGDSNVLTLVNGELIRDSEFYKAAAKADGENPFPGLATVNQFVAAARWRLPEGPAIFETMIVQLNGVTAKSVIAKDESDDGSSPLPPGTIPVELNADTLGLYYPSDRQAAMRWADDDSMNFQSDYLSTASGYATKNDTQIVFSVDMNNALDRSSLVQWIETAPFAGAKQLNPKGAAAVIASMKGCTMGIKCTDRAVASWRFDFGAGVSSLEPVAKPLMLDLIDRLGLSLSSMSQWEAAVTDKSLFLKGTLDVSDMRVLMSVLAQSPETLDRLQTTSGSQSASLTKAESTKMHYDMLNKVLRDITHPTQSILTSGAKANFLERYARKIDELPILNVDEDMLQASSEIAIRLRVQAERLRGNQIEAGTYSNSSRNSLGGDGYNNGYGGGYYNNGGYGRGYGLTDQQVAKQVGRANSAMTGAEQKKEIANLMAELRRTLTQRYQIEF